MYAVLALLTKYEKDSRDTAFNRFKFSSIIRFQIKFIINQGGRENDMKQFKFNTTMCESLSDIENLS